MAKDFYTLQGIPSDLLTSEEIDSRRFKVSTVTRQETQIVRGEFFVGSTTRQGILVNDTYYTIVKAPANKFLVIEDVLQELSFASITDGQYQLIMDAFIDGSVSSSYVYTPVAPTPIGRAMISSSINNFPTSTIQSGVTATPTGDPEYPLTFHEFYIDNGGNRNTLANVTSSFFEKGRQLILAPNGEALVRARTLGDAIGSADIRTTFFTSEISLEEAPTLLGINP